MRDIALLAGGAALAVALAAPEFANEKDLRTRTDAAGETEISFCAKPNPDDLGFPGHVFVAFSERQAGKPRNFRAVGYTVASGAGQPPVAFTYFGGKAVAGEQAEERFTYLRQACLNLKIDRAVYQRALSAARPTLMALGLPDELAGSAESYALNRNDCIEFAIQVAEPMKAVGLNVPERTLIDMPAAYISRMIEANP